MPSVNSDKRGLMGLIGLVGKRSRRGMLSMAALVASVALVLGVVGSSVLGVGADASTVPLSIKVVGKQLVNGSGATVQLRGVDRSGTEYACIQGWGIFDGPSDQASIDAMLAWNVNAVRVPLNEDCWLNINMGNSTHGGAAYQSAI